MVEMITVPLDVEAIVRELDRATPAYDGAPNGLRIGHIHLRVGDVARAEEFYRGVMGLDVMRRRGGATFLSSGRYHHHVGANVWHSHGAGARDPERAGLAWFALEAEDDKAFDALAAKLSAAGVTTASAAGGLEFADPWGTRIRVAKA
jgi:catechol 2,3-dioxygenase